MPNSAALRLEEVAVARGGRAVLSGVSFSLEPGRFAALRGPNGAGKTTLLRALAGLAPIERGSVRFGETRLDRDPEGYREQVVFGGHLDAVKPSMSVRENLAFWTRFYGTPSDGVDAALERFGLAAMAAAPAGHCSAGQKRRLGLARLAAADRPLWLLDEPTVSLDAASVGVLTDLIAAHCAAGGVALAATHQEFPGAALETIDVSAFQPAPIARMQTGDPFLDSFERMEGG